ncbi:hypothetical protein QJS10_CPB15g00813 [Acorus calamus]|uniref:Uncharacterized protein n=1 Tax=Acorus calamus TaxID=4465 RepID=A0AAV9D5H2_ACOCL|nr:hypothetical protein QJS10_CPB15g00813 [Acorus calamus]
MVDTPRPVVEEVNMGAISETASWSEAALSKAPSVGFWIMFHYPTGGSDIDAFS